MLTFLPLYIEKYYVVVAVISLYCALDSIRGNLITPHPKLWLQIGRDVVFRLAGYRHGIHSKNFMTYDDRGNPIDPVIAHAKVLKVIFRCKVISITFAVLFVLFAQ